MGHDRGEIDKNEKGQRRKIMVAQILAVVLFLLMFILIITEKWERHIVTLGCALLTLILVFGVGLRSMSAVT